MITFGHSGVTIAGGSVFDPKDVGFSNQDIDFLKSTGKILPAKSKEEVLVDKYNVKEKLEFDFFELPEDVDVKLEEAEITEPLYGVDASESLNEGIGSEGEEDIINPNLENHEEVIITAKEEDLPKEVLEPISSVTYKLQLEKDDDIKVVMKESDLLKLRKDELVNLAVKYGIEPAGKTKLILAHEIAEANE